MMLLVSIVNTMILLRTSIRIRMQPMKIMTTMMMMMMLMMALLVIGGGRNDIAQLRR